MKFYFEMHQAATLYSHQIKARKQQNNLENARNYHQLLPSLSLPEKHIKMLSPTQF